MNAEQREKHAEEPAPFPTERCPGNGGSGPPCCERAGVYNGIGSDAPLDFVCPNHCPCHD